MKAINSLFANFIVVLSVTLFGLTACTNADEIVTEDFTETIKAIQTTYGAEVTSYSVNEKEQIPSVSMADMMGVLDALSQSSKTPKNCMVESSKGGYFGNNAEEITQKIIMTDQYKVVTRSGVAASDFILRVELSFNVEKGQVYYLGTDYLYTSDLFYWHANGLSLSPVKNAGNCTYEFESESFLYFKVAEQADCVVKVPVIFKGKYDFTAGKGTYGFQLLKYKS